MRILTFLIICLVATTVIARQNFRAEADSFLKTIPDGSQQACASAVLKAINGDTGDLENLRNSRNKETPVPKGVCATNLGNMRLYRPSDAIGSKLPLLVYLHGGGWTIGSINSCAEFCCNLVAEGDMAVLAVDYALAPEHPFPEGLDNCMAAVASARKHAGDWGIDSARISIGGDSSGGNLAFATALKTIQCSLPPLHSIVAFYPVVSAWNDNTPSWNEYSRGFGLDGCYMDAFNRAYTTDTTNILVSPLLAPDSLLRQFPPTLFIAAGRDILRDSGRIFANRLKNLGTNVVHEELAGAVHLFITVPGQPAARAYAVRRTRSFIIDGR